MNVVIAMTVDTDTRRIAMFFVHYMTVIAFSIEVRAEQFEVGEIMIKARLVQYDDLRRATEMLGMTRVALIIARCRVQAMESLQRNNVDCNVVVTGHAQLALTGFVKHLVT